MSYHDIVWLLSIQNCFYHLDLGSLWLLKNVLTNVNKSANSQVGRKMGYVVMLIVYYEKNAFKKCFSPPYNLRKSRLLYLCVALRDVLTTFDPHLSMFSIDSSPD